MRGIGKLIVWGEAPFRRAARDDLKREIVAGGALALGITGLTYVVAERAVTAAYAWHPRLGAAVEVALGWTALATRDLLTEADAVLDALERGDLPVARLRLGRIVGRDTQALSSAEVARAAIETLAESACDGIVAPLCALAAGGVPLALAQKAASTLDSMLGHIEAPYTFFGRAAARLDDAACYVPARATALAICCLAGCVGGDSGAAFRTAWADGSKHRSPNAGQAEAAMAGALRVRLGGRNSYGGVPYESPLLGAEFAEPQLRDARRARTLVLAVACASALAVAAATVDAR